MFGIATKKGGQCMGFPDVCKTPAAPSPIPLPYPNIAMMTSGKGGSLTKKVKIGNKKVFTKKSEISRSSGDEAGTLGGIISSKNMGPAKFKKAHGKVKCEGNGVIFLTTPLVGLNGSNANFPAGVHIAPSQTKVTVMP